MKLIVTTDRLCLRPLSLADHEAVHALWTEPGVRRFLFDDQVISSEQAAGEINDSAERFATTGCGLWGVSLREQPELIGFCGYRPFHDPPQLQLLYGLHPDHWSKGLATEAARAMIRLGFEQLGLDVVVACADAPNTASLKVMEKAGMVFDRREMVNGLDTVFYILDRTQFKPDSSSFKVMAE
jgi:ribosomal-protein-alanine N-acetyltransferase